MGYGVKNAVNHFQSNIPYVNLKHIPNKWTVVQVFGQLGWSKVEIQWLNWGCCYFCYWVKCCNPGLDQAKQCHDIGGHDQGPIASKMSISLGPKCRLTMKGDTEQSVLYCEQSSGVCADVHANLFDLKIKIPVLAMRSPNRWVHLHANFSFEIWLKTEIHSHFMLKMQVLTWVMRNVFCYAFHQPIDCSTKQACKWTSKQAFNKDWIQPIIMNQKPMVIGERNLAWAFSSKLSKSGIRQSAMNIQLSRTTGGQSWRVKLHTRLYNHIVVHAGRNAN